MNTNILLVLDTRRPKQDGTCPVLLRIVHHRIPSQISLGIFIPEKDWDEKHRKIKPSYKGTESVTRLNNLLQKKKAQALDVITKLDELKTLDSFSVLELKEMIERKSDRMSFFAFGEQQIEEMKKAQRLGNARAYKSTLGVLKTHCNEKDLSFQDLNYAFLVKFETAHLAKGNSLNGLAVYMRTIKAIYNKGIKAGLVERELYPFTNYQIKCTKTRKRAISMEAIKRILALELAPGHPLYHARNYFLMSFYMRGMPFADLARLRLSNVIDGRIYYQRQKTDKPYDIKVTAEIQAILNTYGKNKRKEDFLFPIIDRMGLEEQYRDVEWARKRFNKKLKEIAKLCGIQENLTSYVSRHSFATRAKNLGVPVATISDMLGHQNIKTTETYLDSLSSEALDEYHEKIIK